MRRSRTGVETLHERLRRIDYVTDNEITEEKLSSYSAILVDEAASFTAGKAGMFTAGRNPVSGDLFQ